MPRELKPCGTIAAARRHQRKGEALDEACQQAIRDEKNDRADARRQAAAAAAREAMPAPGVVDRDEILHEVLRTLRGQLAEAPPQSVASIAKQIRDTLNEMGASAPTQAKAGGVDDIAARRAEREARRRAATQG